jgi:putative FmdB family regulatory protein
MPRYQYGCQVCGESFEKELRMSQSGETQICPACGSDQTRKRIGAVAVTSGGPARQSAPPPRSPFT